MSYIYLTIHHRNKIEALHAAGFSARYLAAHLHVHYATVSRELKRVPAEQPYAAGATSIWVHKGSVSKAIPTRIQLIQNRLQQTWSTEQLAGRETQLGVSFYYLHLALQRHSVGIFAGSATKRDLLQATRNAGNVSGWSLHTRPS